MCLRLYTYENSNMLLKIYIFWIFIFMHNDSSLQQLSEAQAAEQLYIKLFKRQRAEQLDAIKNFQRVSSYEKQYSMIMLMAEEVFAVIQENRVIIEASPYIPGVSDFPLDMEIKEALSNILENTALFSEMVLRFPDIAVSILKANNNWDLILQWGIVFCHQVKYLLDKNTIKLLHLVSQELNYVERDLDYINPYRKMEEKREVEVENQLKKKKRKQMKKGPKLSTHFEL